MKKFQTYILVFLVLVLTAAFATSYFLQTSLLAENRALLKQLEKFTSDGKGAAPANKSPDNAAAADADADTNNIPELARLRGEVLRLREQARETEKLRQEIQTLRTAQNQAQRPAPTGEPTGPNQLRAYPRESWSFAGYADPEAAVRSLLWAAASGDAPAFIASLTPEQLARMQREDGGNVTPEEMVAKSAKNVADIKAFHVLKTEMRSDDEAVLTLFIDGLEGSEQTQRLRFQRIGGEWKLNGEGEGK